MASSLPGRRQLPESQFDLRTYWGRVRHMANATDPRTLLVRRDALEEAKSLLVAYKDGKVHEMTPHVWRAKKIVDSILHPETGEIIPLPFRMSCFALSGLIVTAGMLTPGLGPAGTIFWQTANQSLNVAINYSNATKSSQLSPAKLAKSYLIAVGASCGIAVGLNSMVPRMKSLSPHSRLILGRLVPFIAVSLAGFVNVVLTRSEELRKGIEVFPVLDQASDSYVPESGLELQSYGRSPEAARQAIFKTAASRVLNAAAVMTLPPLAIMKLRRTKLLRQKPWLILPANLGLIWATTVVSLPLALAVFPQQCFVSADSLEPQFHGKGGVHGQLAFNRGI